MYFITNFNFIDLNLNCAQNLFFYKYKYNIYSFKFHLYKILLKNTTIYNLSLYVKKLKFKINRRY